MIEIRSIAYDYGVISFFLRDAWKREDSQGLITFKVHSQL